MPGWCPLALPEPAATAVRNEPALAWIAASTTLHQALGLETRGRAAGIAYLIQRSRQAAEAAAWAAATQEISAGTTPA